MKILYIANARIPTEKAHGLQIVKMCQAFAAVGNDVTLLIPWRFNRISEGPFDFYNIPETFCVKKLPTLDFIPLDFVLGRASFWLSTATFLLAAKIYLLFHRFDLIYTREDACAFIIHDFLLEIHDLPSTIKSWRKKLWGKASGISVLTELAKDDMIRNGIANNKIMVAPDCVDLSEFNLSLTTVEARKKLSLPQEKPIILYAGSLQLYDWKGVDIFIKTAKLMRELNFLIVGGGSEEIKNLKKIAADNVIFSGRKNHREIPLYMKAADVLVLPNKRGNLASERYTSPLKLFEYMASLRPIVASDLPSIREVLNEKNAFLVLPNDPSALATGINSASKDVEKSRQRTVQAAADVKKYTWEMRATRIIQFVNQICPHLKE